MNGRAWDSTVSTYSTFHSLTFASLDRPTTKLVFVRASTSCKALSVVISLAERGILERRADRHVIEPLASR